MRCRSRQRPTVGRLPRGAETAVASSCSRKPDATAQRRPLARPFRTPPSDSCAIKMRPVWRWLNTICCQLCGNRLLHLVVKWEPQTEAKRNATGRSGCESLVEHYSCRLPPVVRSAENDMIYQPLSLGHSAEHAHMHCLPNLLVCHEAKWRARAPSVTHVQRWHRLEKERNDGKA
jgi:hypothetical protein